MAERQMTQKELLTRMALYGLAELDLPPTVDPTLIRLLTEIDGEYLGPKWVTLSIPKPINGKSSSTEMFLAGVLPGEVAIAFSVPTSPSIAALDGFRVEIFGPLTDDGGAPDPGRRLWRVTAPMPKGYTTFWINGFRRRAFLGDSLLYTELRWSAGLEEEDEHIRIGGLEHLSNRAVERQSQLDRLDTAGLSLKGITRELSAERGRPNRYPPGREPQFFEDLKAASHAAVRNGRDVTYTSLSDHNLASRATVKGAVERFKYDLKAIEAEAAQCTHPIPVNICTFIWRDRAKFKKNRP